MIDTHCHIGEDIYRGEIEDILSKCRDKGIDKLFCVGYSTDMNIRCVDLANNYDMVYAIIGIHPSEADSWNEDTKEKLISLAKNKRVIAIGEIGLDYHFEESPTKEQQRYVLVEQLKVADMLGLPVVIHVRDAVGDLINIFRENKQYLRCGGIIHCYGESFESYKIFKSFGFKVAFGGAITFKNATSLREVASKIPLSDIVLETDCPYLTPEPFRGKTNYPMYVEYVAMKLASIKNLPLREIIETTDRNCYEIFRRIDEK